MELSDIESLLKRVETIEAHLNKSYLMNERFLKRTAGVWGHFAVGYLILVAVIMTFAFFIGFTAAILN